MKIFTHLANIVNNATGKTCRFIPFYTTEAETPIEKNKPVVMKKFLSVLRSLFTFVPNREEQDKNFDEVLQPVGCGNTPITSLPVHSGMFKNDVGENAASFAFVELGINSLRKRSSIKINFQAGKLLRLGAVLVACTLIFVQTTMAQCTSFNSDGNQTANTNGTSINWTQNANSYERITVSTGVAFLVTSSSGTDFITVRTSNNGGTVIASGASPLSFTPSVTTVYIIVNTNSSCNTSNSNRTITLAVKPVISSISSASGCAGSTFSITGTALSGVTSISVNGTNAPVFTINSSTSITVTIPSGATTGTVSVTGPGGTSTSSTTLSINTAVTSAPTITAPICPGSSVSVSGTSTEADGTSITVLRNGTSIGTATVSLGTWTLSSLNIPSGTITATAQASGKCISPVSTSVTVQSASATPVITPPICPGATVISGTSTDANGTAISIYNNTVLIGSSVVNAGTWSVSGLPPFALGDNVAVTALASGKCLSATASITVAITAAPVVNSSLCAGSTSVGGTSSEATGTIITVYKNAVSVGTTTVSGGSWNKTGLTALVSGDIITATAQATNKCISSTSISVTVQSTAQAPVINSPICAGSTSVSGTTTEADGTIITVYKNGTSQGTTTSAAGVWTFSPITLSSGNTVYATASASGKCVSSNSTTITIQNISTTPAISTSTICATTTSISGTSGNSAGIQVFDGANVIATATASGFNGTWTATIPSNTLNGGDVLTVVATQTGRCSATSNPVTVGIVPATPGPITGNPLFCGGTSGNIFSVAPVTGATSYSWTYSGTGATITGGTTASISIAFTSAATSGTLSVTAISGCGTSAVAQTLALTINTAAISYSPNSFCTTNTTAQSVTQTGQTGGSYTASPTGLSIDPLTGAITPSASTVGNYTVTYSFSNGFCTSTTTAAVTVLAPPIATFKYPLASYCQTNPVGTVLPSGTGGGVIGTNFSAVPAGLTINATTGAITLSSSQAGIYTVTNDIPAAGGCADVQSTTTITITPAPTATISYSAPGFCSNDNNIYHVTTTVTSGSILFGSFSAPSGLIIDGTTGDITPLGSTPGSYTVTYTFLGTGCSNNATTTVVISAPPVATFTYPQTAYCQNADGTASPTFSGGGVAGNFSATLAGSPTTALSINATTGVITLASSQPGTYVVTNDVSATGCSDAIATTSITITAPPTATISYAGTPFCRSVTTAQSVTITNTSATLTGSFTATPTGLSINASTGAITPSTSTANTYTVTYTFSDGTCSNTTTTSVVIQNVTATPSIASPICNTVTSISGSLSNESSGTIVTLYQNGNIIGTGPASGGGTNKTWTISGLSSLQAGDIITATAQATGKCISSFSTSVTLTGAPSTPGAITGNPALCPGATNTYTIATVSGATGYVWNYTGTGATITPNGTSASVSFSSTATSGNLTVAATGNCGTGSTSNLAITINPAAPGAPGVITGTANVCAGLTGLVYSVSPVANATGYNWTVPNGWSIISGATTNSITVNPGTAGQNGNISVTAQNSCGLQSVTANIVPVNATNNTGFVISNGTKTSGDLDNSTTQRGYLKFPLTAIPSGVTITSSTLLLVNNNNATASTANNDVKPLAIDPVTANGSTLYTTIGAQGGTSYNTSLWSNTGTLSLPLSAAATTAIQSGIASPGYLALGLSRGGSATYIFYGYSTGVNAPVLAVTYTPPATTYAVTVVANPTISTQGSATALCNSSTSANLAYSATTGSPNQYSIVYNSAAHTAGFTDITNATLPASPITLALPAGLSGGTYSGTLTVTNSSTTCPSIGTGISVIVPNALGATVSTSDVACAGSNNGTINISNPTGGSGSYQYSINGGSSWSASGSFTLLSSNTYDVQIRDALQTSCVKDFGAYQINTLPDQAAPVPDVTNLAPATAECTITVTAPTATDNCAGSITGKTTDSVSFTTQGTRTITWTFDDGNGNISQQQQSVVVQDVTAPVPDVANLATATAECTITVTAPTATDNCAGTITGKTTDSVSFTTQGTRTITWTFDDGNGNISQQQQSVVVQDVTAPVPDVASLATATAECTITVTAPTATDNCAGTITGKTTDSVSFTTQGTRTITWTFDDGNGNISQQQQSVVVQDVTAPVPDVASLATATAECTITVTAPTATDNCAGTITGKTTDSVSFTTQGTRTITWTFDDGNGNISQQQQSVVVQDVTAPVPDVTNLAPATAECTITVTAPTATDNCAGSITGKTTDSVSFTTQGTRTITWTFDDGNGNISQQQQSVVVQDVTAPVPDVTSLAPATAECTITVTAPTATDNCAGSITGKTTDSVSFTTQGTRTITWTFDDGNGNISQQQQSVVVQDVTAPVPDVTSLATATAECTITVTAPTATDNCAGSITGKTTDSVSFTTQGTRTITWTFDDGNGNISQQQQSVVVQDVTAPVPDVTSLATATAECTITVTAPTATDNCAGSITGKTTDSVSFTTQGTRTITWTFDDGNGNISQQQQSVVVQDVTAPVPDVTSLATATAECTITVTAPTATDNCAGSITGTTTDSVSFTTQGTRTINWTFDDGNGNISHQQQSVVVKDVTAPVPDVATLAPATAECSITVTAPTATDNCAGTITGTTTDSVSFTTQGARTITWKFDDGNGNVSQQQQSVIVKNTTAPVPDIAVLPNAIAECTITVEAPTATSNCAGSIIGTTTDSISFTTQGTRIINWNFDDGNGNISQQQQTVIVKDVTAPVPDVANLAPATAECSITVAAPTATDNCAGPIVGTTTDSVSFSTQGTRTITWSFNDGNGNISHQQQSVVVKDVTAPVPDVATLAPATAECSITVTAPTATDNCAGSIVGTTTDSVSFSTQGTRTITWSFNDGNGNISQQQQTVIVKDVTAPVPDVANLAPATAECSITVAAPTATDNCAGPIVGTTTDSVSFSTQGTRTITWSFNDGNGNISQQQQTVIVKDVTAPVPDVANLAPATAECSITVAAPTATDNCAGPIVGTTTDSVSFSTQGTRTITWSFNDSNGNISQQQQTVIVKDVTAPVPDVANLAPATAECSIAIASPTATDNCAGPIVGTTTDSVSFSTQGTRTITWSFNDGNGNISQQQQTVIVKDVTAPVPDVANLAPATAECSITVAAPTATDNCVGSIIGTTTDSVSFTTQGTRTINWNFDDGNGNISQQQQTVIVKDITAPIIICPVITSANRSANSGVCTYTAQGTELDATATDNCSTPTLSYTLSGATAGTGTSLAGIVFNSGTTTVSWQAVDASNNAANCSFDIIVADNQAPTIATPAGSLDRTLECSDALGLASALSLAPSATDNCSATTTAHLISDVVTQNATCNNLFTEVRTWNFTDASNNTSPNFVQTITIVDNTAPTFTAPATATVYTDLNCDYNADPSVTGNVTDAADNCSTGLNATYNDVMAPGSCAGSFVITRTWSLVDCSGNTTTHPQTIYVADTTAPKIISTPDDITVDAGANCETVIANIGILSASDNCSASLSITNDKLSAFPTGTTVVTWTVKDACGNSATYKQNVTVLDHTAPTISNCPSDITVYTADGNAANCAQVVTWTAPTATDNCGTPALVSNYAPGASFSPGTTTVTYTATDANNNTANCSFNVTVIDNTLPVISNCPSNIITCNPSVTWTAPTATDNCGVTSFTNDAPTTFPIGTTTVTYTAKDAAGNTATCSFSVTVNPAPSALAANNGPICAGDVLSLSASGGVSYAWSGPNGFSSTQQNPNIGLASAAAGGLYSVTVTNAYGCTAVATTAVTVNATPVATISGNTPVCSGGTLNLSAGGGTSYSWTGPGGVISLQQNPSISNITNSGSGIYTVTVTNASGCTAQNSILIAVGGTLTPLATSNGPVCEGSTLSFSAAGGTSYSWTGPNGFTSADQNPFISNATIANAGAYTVTVSNASGCSASTTISAIVNAAPVAIASSNSPVCPGVTLSLSAGGGTSYSWTGPNGFTSLQQNPFIQNVTSNAAGVYTVTVTNAAGCTATTTTTVAVNTALLAQASSNTPVCAGSTLNLDASGGTIYSWSGPNGFSSLAQSPAITNVTTAASGIYTVTVSNAAGCTSTTTTNVTVNPAFTAQASSNSPVCEGSALNLSASGGVGYVWSGPNGFASTQSNPNIQQVTALAAGNYSVVVTNASGCTATATISVTVNAVSVVAAITGASPVCAGSSITLSDVTSGGTWSSDNSAVATVNSNGLVTGISGGSTSINYTVSGVCGPVTVSQSITVNAAQIVAAISGTSPIYSGSTTQYTDATTGGTWSSNNNAVASVSSTGLVTGVSGGTTTINYTVNGTCGPVTVSQSIIVNTAVAGISGASSVCIGNTTPYTDATAGGVWSSDNTAVATVNSSGIVTGVSAGSASIKYTISNGGSPIVVSQSITVNAAPVVAAISGSSTVCAGSTTTFSDGTTGGSWSSNNTAIATVNANGVVTGVSGGSTTIVYSVNSTCGIVTVNKTITVNAVPVVAAISGSSTVCAGSTTTFSDGTTGGSWSSNNTAIATVNANGVVAGVSGGSTTIVYSVNSTCGIVTVNKSITVNAAPVVAAISGSSTVCAGSTTTFSDGTTGGSWSSNNTAIATVNANGVVTGVSGGSTTIVYSVNSTCGIVTVNKTITVNAAPVVAAISGSSTVCAGSTTTFSDGTTGGSWSSNNTAIATVNANGVVTGVSGGSTTIVYSVNSTCGIVTVSKMITVNAAPVVAAISGSSTVCAGSTTTFSDGTTGGSWSSNNTAIATVNANGVVTGVSGGSTTIVYSVNSTCGIVTVNKTITVNAAPVVAAISGSSTVCAGSTTTFSDGTTGGSWSSNNTAIATVNANGVVAGVSGGSTTIVYSVNSTCGIVTVNKTITVNAAPVVAAISGSSTVCAGSTTTFSDGTTGGSWSSNNTAIATVNANGVVTGVSGGSTTIVYSVNSTCGIVTVNKTITVKAAPVVAAISGSSTVCAGSTTTFSDGTTGGSWSSNNTAIATVNANGVVTGVSGGSTTIVYSVNSTCGIVTVNKTITVNAAPVVAAISGSSTVCAGSTITFSDGTTGGSWSSNNTAIATVNANGVVTGVSGGSTTIVYSVNSPCGIVTVSKSITVNVAPVVAAITGSATVCTGNTTQLSDATIGGTWSTGNASRATVNSSGLVTGVSSGTVTISYTVNLGCGIKTATRLINVNATPVVAAITGASAVCSGNTIKLSDATTGGTWNTSNAQVATVNNNGFVTGISGGTVMISYSINSNCGVITSTKIITVNPSPVVAAINGTATVCTGNTTQLSDAAAGGTWSTSNALVATVSNSGLVTGINAGTVTIRYTVTTVCGTASSTRQVTVNASPVVASIGGLSTLCAGSTIQLSESTPGGTWNTSNGAVATISSRGFVTGINAGTVTITYSINTVCGPKTATKIITVNATPVVAAITGSATICPGSTTQLADAVAGGNWSSSNASIATVSNSGLVTGISGGNVVISYTVSNNCGVKIATRPVIVSAPVAATITASDAANEFCKVITLTAGSSVNAQSYRWSNGSTSQSITVGANSPAGNYTVTVSAASGCPGTATYNYNPQAVASSYTILGLSAVSLNNNTVQSGSVGAVNNNGYVSVGRFSSVAAAGAFVKARNIAVAAGANVPTRVYAPATVPLPAMQNNNTSTNGLSNLNIPNNSTRTVNGNYRNITVGTNSKVTFTGTTFGVITVQAGSIIRFTQSVVNVAGITLQQGTARNATTLSFSEGAVVRSSGDINIASRTSVNPDNQKVIFYLGNSGDFTVQQGGNTTVNASMYIPNGTLNVGGDNNNRTYMTGKFIAGQVRSNGSNVIWNAYDCSSAPVLTSVSLSTDTVMTKIPLVETETAGMTVQVAPNPSQNYFTLTITSSSSEAADIRVFDMAGRQVDQKRGAVGEPVRFGSQLVQGMYIVQVLQGTNQKLIKVIKN